MLVWRCGNRNVNLEMLGCIESLVGMGMLDLKGGVSDVVFKMSDGKCWGGKCQSEDSGLYK